MSIILSVFGWHGGYQWVGIWLVGHRDIAGSCPRSAALTSVAISSSPSSAKTKCHCAGNWLTTQVKPLSFSTNSLIRNPEDCWYKGGNQRLLTAVTGFHVDFADLAGRGDGRFHGARHGGCHDQTHLSKCPSPRVMQSFCMQHQGIWPGSSPGLMMPAHLLRRRRSPSLAPPPLPPVRAHDVSAHP
jgi:hypothetical protein